MDLHELQAELDAFAHDLSLTVPTHLERRAEALDFIAFLHDVLRLERRLTPALRQLQQQATQLQIELTAVNDHLFHQTRMAIQQGTLTGTALRRYLNDFTTYTAQSHDHVYMSYDGLDLLLDGIFALKTAPAPTLLPTVEMVHCEETPARVLLDLIDQLPWTPTDLFYDLGSGLGQVVMLIHLLTGIRARGVEIEPAFCAFAQAQAKALGLHTVDFINTDARLADYQAGTLFFMFTPFRGQLLRSVLARLQQEAQTRVIRLGTFGSCSPHVADQPWLRPLTPEPRHEYKLCLFESLPTGGCASAG
ncbi:MAG: hypothetical protein KF832_06835 [Caldilineaceae bacterium]|nr:hypothetical protein [Caldilineaceae bacterium]